MAFGGKKLNKAEGFLVGGAASMSAAVCTHPIDLVKVRMQLAGVNQANVKLVGPIGQALEVIRTQGVGGLYKGLSASLIRQITYSSTRFGAYGPIKDAIVGEVNANPTMFQKILAGMLAGAVGAAVGTPADLVMVRMQADGRLPADKQVYKYTHVANGLTRIIKEEGVLALWRGCSPTVVRAMLVTSAQLSVYDIMKAFVVQQHILSDGLAAHLSCSFIAGFVASFVTNPVDVVKTRLMNQSKDASGAFQYRGMTHCMVQTFKIEGIKGLYKGFVPNFMRLGPQTILTMVFYEQFVNGYYRLFK